MKNNYIKPTLENSKVEIEISCASTESGCTDCCPLGLQLYDPLNCPLACPQKHLNGTITCKKYLNGLISK